MIMDGILAEGTSEKSLMLKIVQDMTYVMPLMLVK
jgi:hypothetical protein